MNEEIYMRPAEGFKSDEGHVWLLIRAINGMKQALKAWIDNLSAFLTRIRFTRGITDTCLFVKKHDNELILSSLTLMTFWLLQLVMMNCKPFRASWKKSATTIIMLTLITILV